MKQPRSIAELMWNDHTRLMGLFNDFKSTKNKDMRKAAGLFNRFDKELRNHMLVEERIINSVFKKTKGKENLLPIANSIRTVHKRIRKLLLDILDSIRNGSRIDLSNLFLVLRHHKNVEDRLFYPRLDEFLSDKEKNDIFEKI